MLKPTYFDKIRNKASGHWDTLDSDPELAGPWHQLFKQVQDPRHVISELLQNADDAEATEASIEIRESEFVFSHNGKDFTEEQFASLCRFGYSNKRILHTIGFRGVGFKSTFSLGDEVSVQTPTLSVRFGRKRFTEPMWLGSECPPSGLTEVRIKIKDRKRADALQKNLTEWQDSAVSLLFFKHIRRLAIAEKDIRWIQQGPGPAPGSEWVALSTAPGQKYLKIRSGEAPFPDDALAEIKLERMVPAAEELEFPPCSLDLIMGLEGALFVVLPTGVKTRLPFACNAPFLQDPARTSIRDPSVSPTNRWLLERAGHLAASTLLAWLRRDDLSAEDRCEAYEMLCAVNRTDNTLEGQCGQLVEEAFGKSIKGQAVLLTVHDKLHERYPGRAIPKDLHGVWTPAQLNALFAVEDREILSRHIKESAVQKLLHWDLVERIEKQQVLNILKTTRPPRPDSWDLLMLLWNYLSPELTRNYYKSQHKGVKIFPVHGLEVLHAASEITRLREKRVLRSEEDWRFLEKYLRVLDCDWIAFLDRQAELAEQNEDQKVGERARSSMAVLEEFGLDKPTTADDFIEQVASKMFSGCQASLADHIRIAQIAAKLNASPRSSFRFMTGDGTSRSLAENVLVDSAGDLDLFLDADWRVRHVLHEEYYNRFESCTEHEWQDWLSSGKSGLRDFPLVVRQETEVRHYGPLRDLFLGRGGPRNSQAYYASDKYVLEDWDFDQVLWKYWREMASVDREYWWLVVRRILKQPPDYWQKKLLAEGAQVQTRGKGAGSRAKVASGMLPNWIIGLRNLPCIKDTWGQLRHPAEVMLRTPQTEAFLDVEPFIAAEYDTEAFRPLLIALGLRDAPTGPEKILERLEALSESSLVPLEEIGRWYGRLDSLAQKSSTEELKKIRQSFAQRRLIVAESSYWAISSEVHTGAADDDVPGTLQVHPAFRHLTLWQRIGVPEKPTAEQAIGWLKSLRSDRKLEPAELKRVQSVAKRFPERVWIECGHWPSVDGSWVSVDMLEFGARRTPASLLDVLFASVGQKTADLRFLGDKDLVKEPFANLRELSMAVEERISGFARYNDTRNVPSAWFNTLGSELSHVALENDEETRRVNSLGARLAGTQWRTGGTVEATPHIDGIPVGDPRRLEILWDGSVLYTLESNVIKLAKPITAEIGKAFQRGDIREALNFCYDRPDDFIKGYVLANFRIAESDAKRVEAGIVEVEANAGGTEGLSDKEFQPADFNAPREAEAESATIPPGSVLSDIQQNETGSEAEVEEGQSERRRAKRERDRLMNRFALAAGFIKNGEDLFIHPCGQRIERAKGDIFPWTRCDPSGDLIKAYWVQERCLRQKPIEIEAEALAKLKSDEDHCWLILLDDAGEPVELSGTELIEKIDTKEVIVHVSSYRLVGSYEYAE